MNERKIIGVRHNPEYDSALYEWTIVDKDGKEMKDAFGNGLLGPLPYRYATEEHALAASKPGADPRINTVWPDLPVYEDKQP